MIILVFNIINKNVNLRENFIASLYILNICINFLNFFCNSFIIFYPHALQYIIDNTFIYFIPAKILNASFLYIFLFISSTDKWLLVVNKCISYKEEK